MSSYIKPRRTRQLSTRSDTKSRHEQDEPTDKDTAVAKKFTVSQCQVDNKAGIKLSIKKLLLTRPTVTMVDSARVKLQNETRPKKYSFWNRSSLEAWDENVLNQHKEMKTRSRPSTRSQTVAIEHQELATARMMSDEETVRSSPSAAHSNNDSQEQESRFHRKKVKQRESTRQTLSDQVIQRYLRKHDAEISGCLGNTIHGFHYLHDTAVSDCTGNTTHGVSLFVPTNSVSLYMARKIFVYLLIYLHNTEVNACTGNMKDGVSLFIFIYFIYLNVVMKHHVSCYLYDTGVRCCTGNTTHGVSLFACQ